MACVTHTAQIDLRLGNAARPFLDFGVGSGNFARERSTASNKPDPKKPGTLTTWRAFRAVPARPGAVAGRVLAGALARFALILRVLVTPDRIKALSMFSRCFEFIHFRDFSLTSFRRRTPGPPPFWSMNSTPAALSFCSMISSVFGSPA
jgi:hypothetical protein